MNERMITDLIMNADMKLCAELGGSFSEITIDPEIYESLETELSLKWIVKPAYTKVNAEKTIILNGVRGSILIRKGKKFCKSCNQEIG